MRLVIRKTEHGERKIWRSQRTQLTGYEGAQLRLFQNQSTSRQKFKLKSNDNFDFEFFTTFKIADPKFNEFTEVTKTIFFFSDLEKGLQHSSLGQLLVMKILAA